MYSFLTFHYLILYTLKNMKLYYYIMPSIIIKRIMILELADLSEPKGAHQLKEPSDKKFNYLIFC